MLGDKHTMADLIHLEDAYFTFFFAASYLRTIVAVAGFLALYVYFHVRKVSPSFINFIAAFAILAGLIGQAYATIYYHYVVTGSL